MRTKKITVKDYYVRYYNALSEAFNSTKKRDQNFWIKQTNFWKERITYEKNKTKR